MYYFIDFTKCYPTTDKKTKHPRGRGKRRESLTMDRLPEAAGASEDAPGRSSSGEFYEVVRFPEML